MQYSPLINELINSLRVLPGVGPKSAQRMAMHLLERKREEGIALAETLKEAMQNVQRCRYCRIHTELDVCEICNSSKRDDSLLCVVESAADVFAIESSNEFNGKYFVLAGHLSPLDGLGPKEIGIPELIERVTQSDVKELILATSTTVEGESTAFYISEQLAGSSLTVTRIAHGVPLGGGLEFVDGSTIGRAISGRARL
jgi:recombination protein RecR